MPSRDSYEYLPLLHSWIPKVPETTGHQNCSGRDDIFIPLRTQTTYKKATCFEEYLSKAQSCSGDTSCSTAGKSRKGFLRSRSLSTVQQTFTQISILALGTALHNGSANCGSQAKSSLTPVFRK